MSWPWVVLLVLAAALVVAADWSRFGRAVGSDTRRARDRKQRKANLRLITTDPDSDEFAQSVQRDLDSLPTTDEPRREKR